MNNYNAFLGGCFNPVNPSATLPLNQPFSSNQPPNKNSPVPPSFPNNPTVNDFTSPPITVSSRVSEPTKYIGQAIADPWGGYRGECVSFVKVCTGDHRPTSKWKMGEQVKGNTHLKPGSPIATFSNGKYFGHAAIYEGQDENGIHVVDQWNGRLVSPRIIRWDGEGLSNNGNNFHEIK